jgi:hypothetical protein
VRRQAMTTMCAPDCASTVRRPIASSSGRLSISSDAPRRDRPMRRDKPFGHDHGMLGSGHLFVVEGDVLHQANRIDALLVTDADQIVEGQPGQCDHWGAIERSIVKPV